MTILPFTSFPYKAFKKELSSLEKMAIEPYFLSSFLEVAKNGEEEVLEDLFIPFGDKETLLVKREIEKKVETDPTKTKSSLEKVSITFTTKHCKQTRTKLFYKKTKGKK